MKKLIPRGKKTKKSPYRIWFDYPEYPKVAYYVKPVDPKVYGINERTSSMTHNEYIRARKLAEQKLRSEYNNMNWFQKLGADMDRINNPTDEDIINAYEEWKNSPQERRRSEERTYYRTGDVLQQTQDLIEDIGNFLQNYK